MADLLYSIRGSFGFSLRRGVKDGGTEVMGLALDPKVNLVKCLKFSDDGAHLVYCDSVRTVLIEVSSGKELLSTDLPKTCEAFFSPRGTYLVTYQLYVIWGTRKNQDGSDRVPDPNLRIWSTSDGRLLTTIIASKQSHWRPQFTDDERLMFRLQGSELLVYDAPNFERYVRKVVVKDLAQFLLSPGADPYLACFIPSLKGHPALIQLRQSSEELAVIQTKTTFHGTSCAMSWNSKGSAVLVCATEDVDKSNKSYYGSSMMYCIPAHRDAFKVDLDKDGPIYSYEWSPDSKHFCVCYGYMPSKVTVFNLKGDVAWALGDGHRNEVHYNPFGNILATCAFGNISSGKVQFWDVAKKKLVNSMDINCTTHFAWAPDGKHFYAATTAPRLRINNCYRILDYRNNLLHDRLYEKEELWEVTWCPTPRNAYPSFEIDYPVAGKGKTDATSVYRSGANPLQLEALPNVTDGRYVPPALRGQKKDVPPVDPSNNPHELEKGAVAVKIKRCRDLRRKLEEIKKLKDRRDRGEKLELNQEFKIHCEERYSEELSQLTSDVKEEGN